MASTYDTIIEQGATWTRTFLCQKADGTAVDLYGATARMQVRPTITSETILLSATFKIDPLAGSILATITPEDSAAVNITLLDQGKVTENGVTAKGGLAVYDLELVLPTTPESVVRLVQGRVLISPEVTR